MLRYRIIKKNIIIAKLYNTYYLILIKYNKIRYYLIPILNVHAIARLAKLKL